MGCLRLTVRGVLRGLGYLGYVYIAANSLGIRGWARYVGDSAAEIIAVGDDEALSRFTTMLRHHDSMAIVSEVHASKCDESTLASVHGFYVEP